MRKITYLDFDLQIEASAEGYRTRLLNSPAGQSAATFAIPFSPLELENFRLKFRPAARGVRRYDSPEVRAAKEFGNRLFEAVFGGDVGGRLYSSLSMARSQNAGLRIRLRLTAAPELAGLPWELLYNQGLNSFFSHSVDTPLVRFLDLPSPAGGLLVEPPLRILVMISSPADHPPLDVEREWAKLQESLAELQEQGAVGLERLPEPTLEALLRRLRRTEYTARLSSWTRSARIRTTASVSRSAQRATTTEQAMHTARLSG